MNEKQEFSVLKCYNRFLFEDTMANRPRLKIVNHVIVLKYYTIKYYFWGQ